MTNYRDEWCKFSEACVSSGWHCTPQESPGLESAACEALTRVVDGGQLPIDNNHIENEIRPIAMGRNNGLLVGLLRTGKRGATVTSLIQSARLSGHDPYSYLRDVLTRLPTQRTSLVHELLSYFWQPQT